MDLKMGKSTCKWDSKHASRKQRLDSVTPTERYGIRLSGHRSLDSLTGEEISRSRKEYYPREDATIQTIETITGVIRELMSRDGKVVSASIRYFIDRLEKMKEMFEQFPIKLSGSSLLFFVNHLEGKYDLRIIDLEDVKDLPSTERDTGFIEGLNTLITLIGEISHTKKPGL